MTVTVSSNSRSNNGKEVFYKALCDVFGVVEREYKFHPVRQWRNDYFLTNYNVAIEIEGGVFIGGRHTSGMGFSKDIEKYNAALTLGIVVYRIDNRDLKSPDKIVAHLNQIKKIVMAFSSLRPVAVKVEATLRQAVKDGLMEYPIFSDGKGNYRYGCLQPAAAPPPPPKPFNVK